MGIYEELKARGLIAQVTDEEQIRELVKKSGLKLLHIYDAFTHEPAREDSERVYVICQRPEEK